MAVYRRRVHYYETDKMGITHHANYIHWMEEARIDMLEQIGWGYDRMEELGIQSPVIGIECSYKAPTTFPDEVKIDVKVKEYRGVHLVVAYTMRLPDGTIVLEGTSRHCFMDQNGRFLRMKKEFPELDAELNRLAEKE